MYFQENLPIEATRPKHFMSFRVKKAVYNPQSVPKPIAYRIIRCGVPQEQQRTGADCCSEVVESLVDQIWEEHSISLGSDIKAEIISVVSKTCMMPPGMTDDQLKVAISQQISERSFRNDDMIY